MFRKRYHYSVSFEDGKPPIPENERKRLEALSSYNILDTLPETVYDDITTLAAHICRTPISMVSLIDRSRQWFKSRYGTNMEEIPREIAFCSYAINSPNEILEVKDAREDPRFQNNPLVMEEPKINFYAGAPLITPDGYAMGTICVIDHKPKELTEEQKDLLMRLSRLTVGQLELRKCREGMLMV